MTGGHPARNDVALVQKMEQRPFPCRAGSCPGKGSISGRSLHEATVWVQGNQNASLRNVVEALHPFLQMCCRCSLLQLLLDREQMDHFQKITGDGEEGLLAGQRKALGSLQRSRKLVHLSWNVNLGRIVMSYRAVATSLRFLPGSTKAGWFNYRPDAPRVWWCQIWQCRVGLSLPGRD